MRYIIILLATLFSLSLYGQAENQVRAKINIFSVTGTTPNFTIQGLVQKDYYNVDSIAVSDVIYVSISTNRCATLTIDSIISRTSGVLVATVTDNNSLLTTSFSGIGAVVRYTSEGIPVIPAGLSDNLISCIITDLSMKIDNAINTLLPDSLLYGKVTPGKIPVAVTNDSTLISSIITQSGSNIDIGGSLSINVISQAILGDTLLVLNPLTGRLEYRSKSSLLSGYPTGSGTLNYLPKWTPDGNTLGNSNITDDGSEIQFARPTVLYGVNTAAPGTFGAFGIDNTLGIERPTYYNGSAWVPWLAYSGGTNQYSYFSNSNTITSGTQLTRSATRVKVGDGNAFGLPVNTTVGSQLTQAGDVEYGSTTQTLRFHNGVQTYNIPGFDILNTNSLVRHTSLGILTSSNITEDGASVYFRRNNNDVAFRLGAANGDWMTFYDINGSTPVFKFANSGKNLITQTYEWGLYLAGNGGGFAAPAIYGRSSDISFGIPALFRDSYVSIGTGQFIIYGNSAAQYVHRTISQQQNLIDLTLGSSFDIQSKQPSNDNATSWTVSPFFRFWTNNGSGASSPTYGVVQLDAKVNVGDNAVLLRRYALNVMDTDGIGVAYGTTAQRPTIAASTAPIRFNSDSLKYEGGYGVGDWRFFATENYVNSQIGAISSYSGFYASDGTTTSDEITDQDTINFNGTGGVNVSVSGKDVTIDNKRFGNFTYTKDSLVVDGTLFFGDGIAIYKGYIFSMGDAADSMYVFDIYDNYNIVSKFPVGGTSSPFIHAWNDKLVVTRSDSLRIYDITDTKNPSLLHKEVTGVLNYPEHHNNLIFSSGGVNTVSIFNIETHERKDVTVGTSNKFQAGALAYDNGYLYAVAGDSAPDSLFIIDVNNQSYVGQYGQNIGSTTYTYITASNKHLYALRSDTIDILSIADPLNPVLISKTKSFSGSGPFTRGLFVCGNYLIHCFVTGGFVVYDASDLSNLVALDTVRTTIASNTRAFDIYDNKVYLLSRNEPTIFIYDLPSIKTGHLRSATIYSGKVRAENLITKEIETQGLVTTDLVVNSNVIFSDYGAGNKEAADLSKTDSGYRLGLATDGTVIEIPDSTISQRSYAILSISAIDTILDGVDRYIKKLTLVDAVNFTLTNDSTLTYTGSDNLFKIEVNGSVEISSVSDYSLAHLIYKNGSEIRNVQHRAGGSLPTNITVVGTANLSNTNTLRFKQGAAFGTDQYVNSDYYIVVTQIN